MKATAFALMALITSTTALAEPEVSAKALFYGTGGAVMHVPTAPVIGRPAMKPDDAQMSNAATKPLPAKTASIRQVKEPATNPLGAAYFIRMKNPDGTTKDVLSSRTFVSGERFQLAVKISRPAYVYIFNKDEAGKVTKLYPQGTQSNYINAMGTVFLPAQGAFEFDANPGTEQLLVYLSPTKLNGIEDRLSSLKPDLISEPVIRTSDACTPASGGDAAALGMAGSSDRDNRVSPERLASKGINYAADTCPPVTLASKGIVFSDDPVAANGSQVASYVVKQQSSPTDALHLQIKLIHRRAN